MELSLPPVGLAQRREPYRNYLLAQLAFWGAIAAIHVTLLMQLDRFSWRMAFGYVFASLAGALWTHGMRRASSRRDWLRLSPGRLAPRLALTCLTGGAVAGMSAILLERVIFGAPWSVPLRFGPLATIALYWSALIGLWTAGWYVQSLFRETRRREVAAWRMEATVREAELDQLRAQLDPHFIFNSLNGIRGLVVEDPDRARAMITRLAGTLRYGLRTNREATVPLADELQVVRDYLDLESIRFEERLRVRLDVPAECLEAAVPPLIVQTLVENAIKHGISRRVEGGAVVVEARRSETLLTIVVRNSGTLGAEREGGVGLTNARERLRLLFGTTGGLSLRQQGDEVVARLTIPQGSS